MLAKVRRVRAVLDPFARSDARLLAAARDLPSRGDVERGVDETSLAESRADSVRPSRCSLSLRYSPAETGFQDESGS